MIKKIHRLAAVVFRDITGYMVPISKNEKRVPDVVQYNRDVQKPLVEKYNRKYLKVLDMAK